MKSSEPKSSRSRRPYDASRRQAEARARQGRVIDTARQLFLHRGYGATTIGDIAEAADVSVQFVYAAFESKAGILSRVVDVAIAGDEASPPVLAQPAGQALLAEPDLAKRLRGIVHLARLSHERAAALIQLVESTRGGDPALDDLAERIDASLHEDACAFVEAIPAKTMRRDLTRQQAADLVYMLFSARNWSALVERCGWTPEQYERRLTEMITRLLFRQPA